MNIIIDGPDGTGKSTLVKKLKEYYNIDSIRLSYKDPKDFNFYDRVLEKTDCIFDRQFLSEVVYAPIFGRQCELTCEEIDKLYNKTLIMETKTFILDTDTPIILSRINSRGKEFKEVIDNIDTLRTRFEKLADKYNIEIIDTSKISFEDIIRKVEANEKYQNKKSK